MYLKRKQEKQGLNLKNWFYMGVDGGGGARIVLWNLFWWQANKLGQPSLQKIVLSSYTQKISMTICHVPSHFSYSYPSIYNNNNNNN